MLKSIEELRKVADDCTLLGGTSKDEFDTVWITKSVLLRILDEISEEVEREYIALPKDDDGEPIHVGDMLEFQHFDGPRRRVVKYVSPDGYAGYEVYPVTGKPFTPYVVSGHHHYHEPTVEDVLHEMAVDWDCAADGEDKEAVLKEYAAKLQLKEAE